MPRPQVIFALMVVLGLALWFPIDARADISCDDFVFLDDAQAIITGLGSDPYSLDEPRGTGADPNDGVLCEDRQIDESLLVPLAADDAVAPVLDGLGRDDLPPETTAVEVQSVLSEDFIGIKDTGGLFDNEYNVELIGIETPGWSERRAPDRDCFGEEAAARLAELLPLGRQIYLEQDAAEHKDEDAGSSIAGVLRYVWIQDSTDGRYYLLNGLLVRGGYAVVAIVPPNVKYAGDLRTAEQDAIADGAGLWTACLGVTYPPT